MSYFRLYWWRLKTDMNNQFDWGEYYRNKKLSISSFLNNLNSHKEMFDLIFSLNPKKIIEVGSGSGSMCIFLSWFGFDVLSVDNDQKVLDDASELTKRWHGSSRYAYADAFSLSKSFKSKEFDLAFSQGFFEHFNNEQIEKLVDEQLTIATNVIFSVPSYYYRRLDFGNERLMLEKDWRVILAKYNIVSITMYHNKLRGVKALLLDLFTGPWRLYPWKQPEHLLIHLTSK